MDSEGSCFEEHEYLEHLEKTEFDRSEAIGYKFEGKDYMVGALARMNLNKNALNKKTRKDLKKYLKVFPSKNIFHNNLAQAIEILHCIDDSIEILENNKFKKEHLAEVKVKAATGIGVIEAPRGTLYYRLNIQKDGKIKDGNIIVPTSQNQVNINDDIKKLVEDNINKPKKEIAYEIEKLIRAYDPCLSCAAHFIKLKFE